MERWAGQSKDGTWKRWQGDISTAPEFKGWIAGKHNQAFVMIDGWLCEAHQMRHRVSDSKRCAESCKKAHPWTECHCICGSEHHGDQYDGHVEVGEAEEEAWDAYVDGVMSPAI